MTSFFQTMATIIPVLMVAGLLNSQFLREISKSKGLSIFIFSLITLSLIGVIASVIGAFFALPFAWTFVAQMLAYFGFFTSISYILVAVKMTIFDKPHPARYELEKYRLERKLWLLDAQKRHQRAQSRDNTDDEDHDHW